MCGAQESPFMGPDPINTLVSGVAVHAVGTRDAAGCVAAGWARTMLQLGPPDIVIGIAWEDWYVETKSVLILLSVTLYL